MDSPYLSRLARGIEPYVPGEQPTSDGLIKLNTNENPYPPSPRVEEALRGRALYIDRAHAVELDEDSAFICDLIGCEGSDTNGRKLGKLVDVMQPGGNDVYVFNGPLGEVLVPALKSVVHEVCVEEKRIVFDAVRLNEVAVFNED